MKYAVWLVLTMTLWGGEHKYLLKFAEPVDVLTVLAEFEVAAYRQLGQKPHYRVTIQSNMNRDQVLNKLRQVYPMVTAEHGQKTSVGELESAVSLDSRAIFVLDDMDSRAIFVLDEIEDPFLALFSQHFVTQVQAEPAWSYSQGEGVVVAVLDTGVDMNHEFLVHNLVPGWDFVDDDSYPNEERSGLDSNGNGFADEGWGHGTHVAGIIKTIAPRASIMPIRIADSDGQAELEHIIDGLSMAIMSGARVINLSMSIEDPSPMLMDLLDAARFLDILVVTSAGNKDSSRLDFPASEQNVLTVTSVGPGNIRSPFANYSRLVDVAAPGEYIVSCLPGNAYVGRSGTSMAAPIVAGQAAVILELMPGASSEYLQSRILSTAYDIRGFNPGYQNKLGRGLADVWNSITLQNH